MIDYSYLFKDRFPVNTCLVAECDLLITAWDNSERVRFVAGAVRATRTDWLLHAEYRLDDIPSLNGNTIAMSGAEDTAVLEYVQGLEAAGIDLRVARICVDISGILRPHMMFLTKLLKRKGVRKFEVIYAEPQSYVKHEHTVFSARDRVGVREVVGYGGVNTISTVDEILVVAPGFDEISLAEILNHKESARRIEIFGLPSLQADMYQHNVLKTYRIDRPLPGHISGNRHFAAAADPFAAASEFSAIMYTENSTVADGGMIRYYFAPLGTKPQALGCALFYLTECENRAASIIYPFAASYAPATSVGVSDLWKFTVDFDLLDALAARDFVT